jgi:hypothetical protein
MDTLAVLFKVEVGRKKIQHIRATRARDFPRYPDFFFGVIELVVYESAAKVEAIYVANITWNIQFHLWRLDWG